ncbi:MAG: HAD hydrolase-like protein [Patescibacteria group bacterium]|nr:HAD hydrolase-like protein [Patescibacteria group bacterium]
MFDTVIFDWKRTLYDPDRRVVIDGITELLDFIKSKNIPMILIGKGGEDMQLEVERLGVGKYFRHIVFAEGEKDPQSFIPHLSKDNPKKTLLIGDRVRSELKIGKKLGATTIWAKQGKFAKEEPEDKTQEPSYIVTSLTECLKLLQKLQFESN